MATAMPDDASSEPGASERPKGKIIVILSDGTGNSASALFKTNIWRLYKALDLSENPKSGARQVAYYDDGVGTSSFRPLALLGGAFGVGLKRNVLDLYRFICRNYKDGDQIYAFGFSRGAFTVRVAIGLIDLEGILKCKTEADLNRYSVDAYRNLRKKFKQTTYFPRLKAGQDKTKTDGTDKSADTSLLVRSLRWLRDTVIDRKRQWSGLKSYATTKAECGKVLKTIEFVGVFDTVAAYGMPIAELTRGVDDWIWPLSMPDYKLSPKVKVARHALALGDERDTFHPLLWDEREEPDLVDKSVQAPKRIKQVWFSGMHSDVGGGYPDDALAFVPLLWMIGETSGTDLRFDPAAVDAIKAEANAFAPLHNSRRGLGSYYRLQPRKISARTNPPDPTALIMQDPLLEGGGVLNSVVVHESVLDRIEHGVDRFAPIGLPAEYKVERHDGGIDRGPELLANAKIRASRQEWIWNHVWLRRALYFSTVGVSILMLMLPTVMDRAVGPCNGPQCLLAPLILAIQNFVPGLLGDVVAFYGSRPGLFLVFVVGLVALTSLSAGVHGRMRDNMRALWQQSLGLAGGGVSADSILSREPTESRIYRLRTNAAYQSFLRWMKWRAAPNLFGAFTLFLLVWLVFVLLLRTVLPGVCGSGEETLLAWIGWCPLTH